METHANRFNRALLALDGLSIGDSFGQTFFCSIEEIELRLGTRTLPRSPWRITDDSVMALSIVRCLRSRKRINPDELALMFAEEFKRDPDRGYGKMAFQLLSDLAAGLPWRTVAQQAFDGEGSCGNGGAMRVSPLGAYFADNVAELIEQARLATIVTHAHPDGQTGAIAVALAAAWIVNHQPTKPDPALFDYVLEHLPRTATYAGIVKAMHLPLQTPVSEAVKILGNGSKVTSADTVPLCLWLACRHCNDFVESQWVTASALGDRDTTCAIVGGLVALATGLNGIPDEWLEARETLVI